METSRFDDDTRLSVERVVTIVRACPLAQSAVRCTPTDESRPVSTVNDEEFLIERNDCVQWLKADGGLPLRTTHALNNRM